MTKPKCLIYGLSANGTSVIGGSFRTTSQKLFKTKKAAKAHFPDFKRRCCDQKAHPIFAAYEDGLHIKIVEYELVE